MYAFKKKPNNMAAAALPTSLKQINSYIKLAKDYDRKDPVVAYFCKYIFFSLFSSIKKIKTSFGLLYINRIYIDLEKD